MAWPRQLTFWAMHEVKLWGCYTYFMSNRAVTGDLPASVTIATPLVPLATL